MIPKRIGILRLSAIGDVVHAMPLAMGVRRAYPAARVTWIVQEQAAPLLAGHPAVDDVLLFPRRGGPAAWRRFLSALRSRRLQATIDPQGNAKSGLVALLSRAPLRAGLHPRDCKEWVNALASNRHGRPARGPHGVDRAWRAGEPLGIRPGPDRYGLHARDDELAAWKSRSRLAGVDPGLPLVAFHLTDPGDIRSWTVEGWTEAARALLRRGRSVVLNGTAARAPLAREIAKGAGERGLFDLTGTDDLRGLLAQLESMARVGGSVLLSPDSGPVHMAVAVGLPVVCLSGPQDPRRTGPRSGGVALTAWEGLSCAPCLERTCLLTPPDRPCMRHLRPEAVVEAVLATGGGGRGGRGRSSTAWPAPRLAAGPSGAPP